MENRDIFTRLPGALLPWYEENKRDLPWRKDRLPYHIWVSEIMLQQTRVEAVKGYYTRFVQALPTIEALAKVTDEQLYKLWEGLGYYTRVRNLKKAAQVIVESWGGIFPGEYDAVLSLPGIGEYTAGAICSIAYDQPTPAVDGNVLRVVSRLTNDPTPIDMLRLKRQVQASLAEVYPSCAGQFTQALMELGATVCGPNRKPDCENCPCKDFCLGHLQGTAETLPVKRPKADRRVEEKTVFILTYQGSVALEKRPDSGLLGGMWQFPNVTGKLGVDAALKQVEEFGFKPKEILRQVEKKHIFTHIEWCMNGIYVEVAGQNDKYQWYTAEQIANEAALPTAFRQFWDMV